ncbi:MAG TPA: hypothetical protein VIY48_21985 [Candidatus Paceibacterota bacterium]
MSKGSCKVTLRCPNSECGHEFVVTANWWDYPATGPTHSSGGEPPDQGVEMDYPDACPVCKQDFMLDEVEDQFISAAWEQIDAANNDRDEGPDFEEFYERYKEGLND